MAKVLLNAATQEEESRLKGERGELAAEEGLISDLILKEGS
jgi:hypothetical protein